MLSFGQFAAFNLFIATFVLHLQKIFWPQAPAGMIWALALIPPLLYLSTALGREARSLDRGLALSVARSVALSQLAFAVVLPILATELIVRNSPALVPVWPWLWNWREVSLPIYYPLLGLALASLGFLALLKRWGQIWPFLILTSLADMFIFSYVKRVWSFDLPLHFLSAILLQFTLSWQHSLAPRPQPQTTGVQEEDIFRRESPAHPLSGILSRALWVILTAGISLTLGLQVPTLAPIWFQHEITLSSILGHGGKQAPALDGNTLFAWKNAQLGGPWQGDNTPLFFVQGPHTVYWQSQMYDLYDPRGWWSQSGVPSSFNLMAPVQIASFQGKERFQVRMIQPMSPDTGLLFPEQIASLDQISQPDATFNYYAGLETLWSNQLLPADTQYTLHATLSTFQPAALRQDQTLRSPQNAGPLDWSPWNMHHAGEIVQLTHRIAQEAQTPYDKVQALSNYLKNSMTYDLNPPPAADGDFVSDFLLVTHEGYCIHFASALAVMTRILGYPTRLVMGFTSGQPLPDDVPNPFPGTDRSTVRVLTREDAHSWVEVYFQGYGWVSFEATPGFANPQEPTTVSPFQSGNSSSASPASPTPRNRKELSPSQAAPSKLPQGPRTQTLWESAAGILLVLSLCAVFFIRCTMRRRRRLAMSEQEQLAHLYWDLLAQAEKKGLPHRQNETPGEFLQRLPADSSEWVRAWVKLTTLVEEGLFGPGDGVKQLEEAKSLKPEIERMLNKHFRPV